MEYEESDWEDGEQLKETLSDDVSEMCGRDWWAKWERGPNRKRYVNENTGKLIFKTGAEAESRSRARAGGAMERYNGEL